MPSRVSDARQRSRRPGTRHPFGPQRTGATERDELLPFLRDGKVSVHTPPQVVQTLQRMVGNKAVAAAMGGAAPTAVQRFGVTDVLDKVFGKQAKLDDIERLALNPVAWQHFRAFATKEFSVENCDYWEEYVRAKHHGGGGNNQRLYDMVMNTGDGELNISNAQRAELKKKAGNLFWARPLDLFGPVTTTVQTNLADTMSRFQFTMHGKKAAQALTAGESSRTKLGRLLGERQSRKSEWVRNAEKEKRKDDD